ncbi:MAG: N-acetylmuramoyl-L-alanine amidase [Desulfobacterium sp.]|nr:N-acetylmuramoyl-L-alanine amidase [Desulfobacterium sp.]
MKKLRFSLPALLVFVFLGLILPCSCASLTAQQQYSSADLSFLELKKEPAKQKSRQAWVNCIELYQRVYADFPESPWAPAGMYRTAQLYLELNRLSLRSSDKTEAVDLLNRIQGHYPQSAYKERANHLLREIAAEDAEKNRLRKKTSLKQQTFKDQGTPAKAVSSPAPKSKPLPKPEAEPPSSPTTDTRVTGLRFWSTPEYTRVVIDAEDSRPFIHHLLKRDPAINMPQRLYVDLECSRLGKDVPKHTAINDDLLIQARAGQYTPHSVRVVIDIKAFDNYKVFSLNDPFRLVIDVWAKESNGKEIASQSQTPVTTNNILSSAITKQLALGVRRIVIDPGHGGKDPGAPGDLKNVWEKDVVLSISKRLAARMRDRLRCDVILTRSTDTYLTLEERTAIANTKKADLFISLHCNAALNRKAHGIETYFLNLATDDEAIAVAARENATSRKNISDLESILNDLMKNAKINESSRLAGKVQKSICAGLEGKYSNIKNLGVKQAPFYVLLGARMPSILVETSFLSNRTECQRLVTPAYQEHLCEAIIDGVEQYIRETNPQ